jgi:uncharacterized coiled-coil protein SlyX
MIEFLKAENMINKEKMNDLEIKCRHQEDVIESLSKLLTSYREEVIKKNIKIRCLEMDLERYENDSDSDTTVSIDSTIEPVPKSRGGSLHSYFLREKPKGDILVSVKPKNKNEK